MGTLRRLATAGGFLILTGAPAGGAQPAPLPFPAEVVRLHLRAPAGEAALALRLDLDPAPLLAALPAAQTVDLHTLSPEELPRPWLLVVDVQRGGERVAELRYPLFVQGFGASAPGTRAPLVLAHPLAAPFAPGRYELVLRLAPASALPRTGEAAPEAAFEARFATDLAADDPAAEPLAALLGSAQLLAEGQPNLVLGPPAIAIADPPFGLLLDRQPFSAATWGPAIAAVEWQLDGKATATVVEPPFKILLDLGLVPREHQLAAVARNARGEEIARDEIRLNTGPHRFRVRLLEPRTGAQARGAVRVRAAVEMPEGETLAGLEIYTGDRLAARFDREPFVATLPLPAAAELTVVRAVAHLASGATAESTALLNTPPDAGEVAVDLVQLYLTASDRRGRLVNDLGESEVRVFEDGKPQALQRFEKVIDLPLDVAVLLDVSESMERQLGEAARAAERFFASVLTPRDRAELVTFNHRANLAVPFTADRERLALGLVGLKAEGGTALWDSVALTLYSFGGLDGRRAIVLLSDGADSDSRLAFARVVEYAHRVEATIYAIGVLPMLDPRATEAKAARESLRKLDELARATGGRSFAIETVGQLPTIYQTISAELRSQYLLAYPSSQAGAAPGYRRVKVELTRPGLTAATMEGYFAE